MDFKSFKQGRFSLIYQFGLWYLITAFLVRFSLGIWQLNEVSLQFTDLLKTLFTGFIFDVATCFYILIPTAIYYVIFPNKLIGSKLDRILIWFFTALTVFIFVFAFFAEFTFWEEFRSRFNFIAVDYLIYTHEVISNIQESYPLPILILAIVLITAFVLFLFVRNKAFFFTFHSTSTWKERSIVGLFIIGFAGLFTLFLSNSKAEWSSNRYNSELSKSGVYSFFAAFRNNQMKYPEFYSSISNDEAFQIVRQKLGDSNSEFSQNGTHIHRKITAQNPDNSKPNVVFILVESLSGSFLKEFGNQNNITPFLDSLAQKSIFFSNLYATGTRTVRGMEAVTLSIPPTPGQSIVKRPENAGLFTISNVFQQKGYTNNFFYGGDGYFDNMNAYFGGNGFTIYDRGRGSVLSDKINTERHLITNSEVTFENAWGICDEDIFNKMIQVADASYTSKKPFFNFVMTTSNHRPYTYPSGKIDIPSGSGRDGAVKYTDYALSQLFKKVKNKPWFQNTVFVIIADHCASSAGRNEIDVKNYHIPAFIVNAKNLNQQKIITQCSQIDIFPTLFSLFNWSYESDFFGKNVLDPNFMPRSFVATYRKLGYMKGSDILILSDQKKQSFYKYNISNNDLIQQPMNSEFLKEGISFYQTADYLFTQNLLH